MIRISCTGQSITATTDTPLVANTIGRVQFSVTLDSEWDGLNVDVVFTTPEPEKTVLYTGPADVPWEVLQSDGRLNICCVGRSGSVQYPTMQSKTAALPIYQSGPISGGEPLPEPSPDVPHQALEIANGAAQTAEEAAAAVSNKLPAPPNPEVGNLLEVTEVKPDGTYNVGWTAPPSGGGAVDDVQLNGESIVENGVASIPYATPSSIADRTSALIGGTVLDDAVKAAMCDGVGAAWTDTEKQAARARQGIITCTQAEYDSILDHGSDLYIILEEST